MLLFSQYYLILVMLRASSILRIKIYGFLVNAWATLGCKPMIIHTQKVNEVKFALRRRYLLLRCEHHLLVILGARHSCRKAIEIN